MTTSSVYLKDAASLGVGGIFLYKEVDSVQQLHDVLMTLSTENIPVRFIGNCTNIYASDENHRVILMRYVDKSISYREDKNSCYVTAGAMTDWDFLVSETVKKGLSGLENLSLIPGSAGASVVQNIGAYGVEVKGVVYEVCVFNRDTMKEEVLSQSDCQFGYRDSVFKQFPDRYVVLKVTYILSKSFHPVLTYNPLSLLLEKEMLSVEDVRREVVRIRKEKLPDVQQVHNAGSFFKNPIINKKELQSFLTGYPHAPYILVDTEHYKIPAAWLIEHVANMKGVKIGNVGTWYKQPLVVVTYEGVTCGELEGFVLGIVEKIKRLAGITLEQEVEKIY